MSRSFPRDPLYRIGIALAANVSLATMLVSRYKAPIPLRIDVLVDRLREIVL